MKENVRKWPYHVSGKVPTYPSPKPTVWPKWEVSDDVDVGEGWVVSFPEPKLIQSFFREKGKTWRKETKEREPKSLLSPFSLG